ncbi:MAG: hypothetical protein ACD_16C00232G0006 [uncultured bacterium]|nr:MAG: hypothetical protein ACD_16C00232G0006 [uncultured bacterium]OFW69872.1 MAG: F420-dependent oxidoreductase [Alphaproteobacteria bacterium GWC2_42_16]OFW73083.1 MAG: F420-dependent oxidoreductase [Alphaproteobacteria bacterium GWA2_41_27]OFW81657.1 MAG: F420-dependent oxidoreductase [Alphaproteobacteria bacterium RIFCSPHIGHO2_12_FULL_42_100]OFW85299.1 MAG: F420-dependent oxidoreductase [Alphaproteobacteria bacterium RBG_16_42_14]OFW90557.1 MAG: F420-dependent oxidoreductase [Alphaproteo
MHTKAIKTTPIEANHSLTALLDEYVPPLKEGTILAISSKVVSLCEGRIVSHEKASSKYPLIQQEADAILEASSNPYDLYLTLIHGILIPSAGVDESNCRENHVLYPQDPQRSANQIWEYLRERDELIHVGVILTDSRSTPLRRGVLGFALSWCGFNPLRSYVGKPDIYGKDLRTTQMNCVDALAASAVLVMGEGAEQTPIVLLTDVPSIEFLVRPPLEEETNYFKVPMKEDLYAPLLQSAKWIHRIPS